MRYPSFFLLFVLTTISSFAQTITNEEVFPIKDYSVFEEGYPLMVAPGGGDDFMYIEFWPENIAGRQEQNYYLQKYRITDYSEIWYKPLSYIGYDQIPDVMSLNKMDKKYVATGHQYSDKEKRFITVARFWDVDGKSPDLEPITISKYGKSAPKKDLTENLYFSPSEKCMMWHATSGDKHYATAWTANGENLWDKEFVYPMNDRYNIKDLAVDDKGNVAFLLLSKKLNYSRKDSVNKPFLMYFDVKSGKYNLQKIPLDSTTYMLEGKIKLLSNEEVVVAGVLSDYDPKIKGQSNFNNGGKIGLSNHKWSHLYCGKIKLGDTLRVVNNTVSLIPDNWIAKYKDGSNFSSFQLSIEQGALSKGVEPTATLIAEEQFRAEDKVFFNDIAMASFRTNTGALAATNWIVKKQRDQGSGNYLSFSLGKTKGKLHYVYMSEMGAAGKLLCQTLDLKTGKLTEKALAVNDQSLYYFFPSRSKMVSGNQMILIGVGNPSQNNYKLMTITF